jgi:hypothetical protein
MVAVRFKSFIADSLRAIQICFNDSYQNANLRSFDLMVWKDLDGVPGEVIYSQEDMMVTQGKGINGFYTYVLADPIGLNGSYFIGWKQRSETFLNAGFDINTLPEGRQFYWLNGNWNSSQAMGTIMIRPQFGPAITNTGISGMKQNNLKLKIWPNPAYDILNVDPGETLFNNQHNLRITDIYGHELIRTELSGPVDISLLKPGTYIVTLFSGNRPTAYGRFIKSR